MVSNKLLFLSDVHIGSNETTNWYQRDLHEGMLAAIFDYALANARNIAEFIILGDLIDQWTYVPDVAPPSVERIAASNPNIFGNEGAIAKLARTMPERVTFMPGNHDMALTADALSNVVGEPIRSASSPLYAPAAGKGQVVCTHGHIYSLFNAPDPVADPQHNLPLGHYITRLCALDAQNKLGPTQTVADLPQSGDPTGTALLGDALKGIVESFLSSDSSLSRAVMDTLLAATFENADTMFKMFDGRSISAEVVTKMYDRLYESYGSGPNYPSSIYGRDPALMALIDTDARSTIAHFAEILSCKYPVIVMGHTHAPLDDQEEPLFGKEYVYVNSGFNCPSKPDIAAQNINGRATFVEVTVDEQNRRFVTEVRYVEKTSTGFVVAPNALGAIKTVRMR